MILSVVSVFITAVMFSIPFARSNDSVNILYAAIEWGNAICVRIKERFFGFNYTANRGNMVSYRLVV